MNLTQTIPNVAATAFPLPTPMRRALDLAAVAAAAGEVPVGAVVAGRLGEDPRAMDHPAALGIVGGEANGFDSRQCNCRGAHRARLERHP